MRNLTAIGCAILLLSSSTKADPTPHPAQPCAYNFEKINNMCAMVVEKMEDPNPNSEYSFLYAVKMDEAACVDPSEPEEVKGVKYRELWRRHGNRLVCEGLGYHLTVGQLAISNGFTAFVQDVVNYDLGINDVDSEGRTLLDFTESQLRKPLPNIIRTYHQEYRDMLLERGAKNANELTTR